MRAHHGYPDSPRVPQLGTPPRRQPENGAGRTPPRDLQHLLDGRSSSPQGHSLAQHTDMSGRFQLAVGTARAIKRGYIVNDLYELKSSFEEGHINHVTYRIWLTNIEKDINRLTSPGSSVYQPSSGMEERRSPGHYFSRNLADPARPVPNQTYRTPQVSQTTRRDTPRVTWDDVYDHLPLLENDHRNANALQLAHAELDSGRLAPSDELLTLLRNMLDNPDTWHRQHESAASVTDHPSFPVPRNGPQPRTNGAHESPRSVQHDHRVIVDGMYVSKTPAESITSCLICLDGENPRCTFVPENSPNAGGETYHPGCLEQSLNTRGATFPMTRNRLSQDHITTCEELYRTSETVTTDTSTQRSRRATHAPNIGRPAPFRV